MTYGLNHLTIGYPIIVSHNRINTDDEMIRSLFYWVNSINQGLISFKVPYINSAEKAQTTQGRGKLYCSSRPNLTKFDIIKRLTYHEIGECIG